MPGTNRGSSLLLRMAVALAFLYPPIDAFFHPDSWVGFFPVLMRDYVPGTVLLPLWGIVEIIIALWILSGKKIFVPACAATLSLVLIVLFNFSLIDILFRDLAIAFAAASLAWLSYAESHAKNVS